MQSTTQKPRLLVKAPAARAAPNAPFAFGSRTFAPASLFSADASQPRVEDADRWYVAEAEGEPEAGENPWDVAYRALEQGFGFASADQPVAIEPDLVQAWPYENPTALTGPGLAFGADEVCAFHQQDTKGDVVPVGPEFAWFLRDDFSQLGAARDALGANPAQVVIAHLDTGYDPDHVTLPDSIRADLDLPAEQRRQRNFVEDNKPHDASDPGARGLLRNPGHGTATLGILAGNRLVGIPEAGPREGQPLGGAPGAQIVAMRVADSVAHFRTSSIAQAIEYAGQLGCDVLSMSMGGVPSSAWADAVDFAYERGVVLVCAAGNNFGGLPIRHIVYPARFPRVLAVCGVMADGRPYNDLPRRVMQGNWGPKSKMKSSALSAYTPNMPWAEMGCAKIVDMDGGGTSAATPQVAAAAALWLMKHNPQYAEPWMRVEAVRKALFASARDGGDVKRLGIGILQARAALDVQPAVAQELKKSKQGRGRFALLRLLSRFGVSGDARREMFEMEASQLLQSCKALEEIVDRHDLDPEQGAERNPAAVRELVEAMAVEPRASATLREYLQTHFAASVKPQIAVAPPAGAPQTPRIPPPPVRELKTYSLDPSLGAELETFSLNHRTVPVRWEHVQPGPVGEYIEVVDIDPASRAAYAPVDLNDPHVLATDGLEPTLGDPRFHQQMVYAVAMRTIEVFEEALGRAPMWASRSIQRDGQWSEYFVRRLRIYPHALRDDNAFYSPNQVALLFGYFGAHAAKPGRNLPGGTVFTCLSQDIIAHETTHALLDGLHPRFSEDTNDDVFAFHEGFSDVMALFQHFDDVAVLRHQIATNRGDLSQQNLLAQLARQFGEAQGKRGALRDAIGYFDPVTKQWQPHVPEPTDYQSATEAHERGAVLVAAIFEAFLAIYSRRTRDLMRLASGGTGVLPPGAIPPDLVNRLADEASTAASHVLRVCVRALDYCPPMDITFGDYLRALITADSDLVRDDSYGYRVAFIEGFRKRGIYPEGVRNLSVESLRWSTAQNVNRTELVEKILGDVGSDWAQRSTREREFEQLRDNRKYVHGWAKELLAALDSGGLREMGLAWGAARPARGGMRLDKEGQPRIEIHSLRPTQRRIPGGAVRQEAVVEITQARDEWIDPDDHTLGKTVFRGGCTMIVDPEGKRIRYCVTRDILDEDRLRAQRRRVTPRRGVAAARRGHAGAGEPFALLHREH